jgi:hypothetical protein
VRVVIEALGTGSGSLASAQVNWVKAGEIQGRAFRKAGLGVAFPGAKLEVADGAIAAVVGGAGKGGIPIGRPRHPHNLAISKSAAHTHSDIIGPGENAYDLFALFAEQKQAAAFASGENLLVGDGIRCRPGPIPIVAIGQVVNGCGDGLGDGLAFAHQGIVKGLEAASFGEIGQGLEILGVFEHQRSDGGDVGVEELQAPSAAKHYGRLLAVER